MTRFHLSDPCEQDAVTHLQHVRTAGGMYLIVLASDGRKNIEKLRHREGRHIWRAQTSHGTRWAEFIDRVGWRVTKEEPK